MKEALINISDWCASARVRYVSAKAEFLAAEAAYLAAKAKKAEAHADMIASLLVAHCATPENHDD